jgi:hypothetical protein
VIMVDLDNIRIEDLLNEHPDRLTWSFRWPDFRLLYEGGDKFIRSAGDMVYTRSGGGTAGSVSPHEPSGNRRRRRFLWQLEGEPDNKYLSRWDRSAYANYAQAIMDYFRQWLWTTQPVFRCDDGEDQPDWFVDFFKNANGNGKPLMDVGKDSFLDLLTVRRCGWLLGRSDNVAADDADVVITPYSAEEILDWERSNSGELEWIILAKERSHREFPDRRMTVKTITYLDREQWRTWELTQAQETQELNAEVVGSGTLNIGRVPFVFKEIPHGLWIADKLFSPCVSLFNRQCMLEYAQHMGCFLQPYIKTNEDHTSARSRILGEGVLLRLRAGMKDEEGEDYGWKSPDVSPLEFIAKQLKEDRDEIYRIVHQMSLAVDSHAVGAIARSGASKIEDRRASEVMLCGYGNYERSSLVELLNLVSLIKGDNNTWQCDGFDNFDVSSLDTELQTAALVTTLPILDMSPTLKKHVYADLGIRLMERVDEETKEAVRKEIEDSVDADEESKLAMPMTAAPRSRRPAHAATQKSTGSRQADGCRGNQCLALSSTTTTSRS